MECQILFYTVNLIEINIWTLFETQEIADAGIEQKTSTGKNQQIRQHPLKEWTDNILGQDTSSNCCHRELKARKAGWAGAKPSTL